MAQQPLERSTSFGRGPGFDPRIDADEFEEGSLANVYIRAKAGEKLQVKELDLLPSSISLQWLKQRSPTCWKSDVLRMQLRRSERYQAQAILPLVMTWEQRPFSVDFCIAPADGTSAMSWQSNTLMDPATGNS